MMFNMQQEIKETWCHLDKYLTSTSPILLSNTDRKQFVVLEAWRMLTVTLDANQNMILKYQSEM